MSARKPRSGWDDLGGNFGFRLENLLEFVKAKKTKGDWLCGEGKIGNAEKNVSKDAEARSTLS